MKKWLLFGLIGIGIIVLNLFIPFFIFLIIPILGITFIMRFFWRKNRKFTFVALSTILIILLILLVANFNFKEKWKTCNIDEDCILVNMPSGCCHPCGEYSINSQYKFQYGIHKSLNSIFTFERLFCYNMGCAPCYKLGSFEPYCTQEKICSSKIDCEKTCDMWQEKINNRRNYDFEKVNSDLYQIGCECDFSEIETKKIIEKEFFVDGFQDDYFIIDIFWEKGTANFKLVDPDGLIITRDNINSEEIQKKYRRVYSRDTRWQNGSKNSESFIITRPKIGYWEVIASNKSKEFEDFSFIQSGSGEHNMWLYLWHEEKSYIVKDKITITSVAGGPFVAKNIKMNGFVYYAEECSATDLEKYYEKAKTGKNLDFVSFGEINHLEKSLQKEIILHDSGLKKHGDVYEGDGRYSILFNDFFGGVGCYIFHIWADNLEGNGMTVVPSDHPDFVGTPIESTKISPFLRSSVLVIEVRE